MNRTQEYFCEWNAERLSISVEESRERYFLSLEALPNGHGGAHYREFYDTSHELFSVFFGHNKDEVFDTYEFHGYLHFLRMLSYREPVWKSDHPLMEGLAELDEVTILDFGCGLAQASRSIAQYLSKEGKKVNLILVDIDTVRREFLLWLGEKTGIPTTFLICTREQPIPDLDSPIDVCIAKKIFEHLHDPLPYLLKIDDTLSPGGFLLTDVSDHKREFMHVSPNLTDLRNELKMRGYLELKPNVLFRKRK